MNPYLIPLRPRSNNTKRTEAKVLMPEGNNNLFLPPTAVPSVDVMQQQQQRQQQPPSTDSGRARSVENNGGISSSSTTTTMKRKAEQLNNVYGGASTNTVVRYRHEQQPHQSQPSSCQQQPHRPKQNEAPSTSPSSSSSSAVAAPSSGMLRATSNQTVPASSSCSSTTTAAAAAAITAPRSVPMFSADTEAIGTNRRANIDADDDDDDDADETVAVDVTPPAADDAARQLARMVQEQRIALNQIRETAELKRLQQQQQQQENASHHRRNNNTHHHQEQQQQGDALLPATFIPVPPSRWRVPPLPPPRARLVADGPRLDLLETLEKLELEDRLAKLDQQQNYGSSASSSSSSSIVVTMNTAGKRLTSDLWVTVFEFLEARELCRCAEVSKRWLCISRSEFLWSPILNVRYSHLISEDESEVRFLNRVGGSDDSAPPQLLAAAPPRPSGEQEEEQGGAHSQQQQQQQRHVADATPFSMCPSLTRISNFVDQHRGRVLSELRAVEDRLTATESRINDNWRVTAGTGGDGGGSSEVPSSVTAAELGVTNERNVLTRQLQELEPKLRQLLERLREAEACQATQARTLNEAIVSSKRSTLHLSSISRRAQIVERKQRDKVALEELERRICSLVLSGSGGSSLSSMSLPATLRKSIHNFSQLELLLLSCANQEALSNLPKRWQKVKDLVSVEVFESLKKEVEECEDPKGVLEGKLSCSAVAAGGSGASAASAASASGTTSSSGSSRFSDCLFRRGEGGAGGGHQPRISYQRSSSSSSSSGTTSAPGAPPRANNNHTTSSTTIAPQFGARSNINSTDVDFTKQKIVAEMCTMDDATLEMFLFSSSSS